MIQFYLLSVLLNLITGLLLISAKEIPKDAIETSANGFLFFETKNFRLIIGILAVFIGIMKFLSVFGNDFVFFGDLLPALAGIVGGVSLLYEYYIASSSVTVSLNPFFENIFVKGHRYVGVACVLVAILHFIFPRVLFL